MTHLPDAAAATCPEPSEVAQGAGWASSMSPAGSRSSARTVFGDSGRTGANASRLMENQRLTGRCAWVAAWVGLVAGQLHALSRFATDAGAEDLALPPRLRGPYLRALVNALRDSQNLAEDLRTFRAPARW
jgi:hypothetical protein